MPIPVNRAMLANQLSNTNSTKIDQFPEKIGSHGMLMVFNRYEFVAPGSAERKLLQLAEDGPARAISQSNGAILLPIPNELADNTGLIIPQENLVNTFGAESAARSMAAIAEQGVTGAAVQGIKDVMSSLTGNSNISPSDALYLAKRLFGDNFLLGPTAQGVGMALNPKASLMFQGVNLKEFQFRWELAPSEEKESVSIKNIINKLKSNALPWYNPDTTFTSSILRYPSTVDIYFLGVDPGYFFFFKTAMITNMASNYTPHGLSLVRGGRPSSVELSISLKEMDIHTANDYGLTESAVDQMADDAETRETFDELYDQTLSGLTQGAAAVLIWKLLQRRYGIR